jgi:hypothetical protein
MITEVLIAHPHIMGVYFMYAFGADRVIIDAFTALARNGHVFSLTTSTTTTSNS